MSPGEKVCMRVKPRELMACADVLRVAGVDIQGVSLSSLVRLALNVLVESAIKEKRIPDRTGFEYNELLTPFKRANIRTKVQVGQTIALGELHRAAADLPNALGSLPDGQLTNDEIATARSRTEAALRADGKSEREIKSIMGGGKRVDPRIFRRNELRAKSEADPANMSTAEFRELRRLDRDLASA